MRLSLTFDFALRHWGWGEVGGGCVCVHSCALFAQNDSQLRSGHTPSQTMTQRNGVLVHAFVTETAKCLNLCFQPNRVVDWPSEYLLV